MKRTLIFAAMLTILFAACNLPTGSGSDAESIATLGAVTSAAPTLGQAPTLMPVPSLTAIPFENTPNPTAPVITVTFVTRSGATRIQFAQGGVGATIIGSVVSPGLTEYILYAFQGQRMYVDLSSPNNAANFSVISVSRDEPIKRFENEQRTWDGILPLSDDYIIAVALGSGTVDFKLSVTILWQ